MICIKLVSFAFDEDDSDEDNVADGCGCDGGIGGGATVQFDVGLCGGNGGGGNGSVGRNGGGGPADKFAEIVGDNTRCAKVALAMDCGLLIAA